jgi:hypothetical protein
VCTHTIFPQLIQLNKQGKGKQRNLFFFLPSFLLHELCLPFVAGILGASKGKLNHSFREQKKSFPQNLTAVAATPKSRGE